MARTSVDLLLVLHNHQPHGNFEHVFVQALERCYRPVLQQLAAHPRLRWAVHHSGPLLEWLEVHQPRYLEDLRALVQREQVELLGGGFYEPLLSLLPDRDVRGQLEMMESYCEAKLGQAPRGMWLAELAWDADLPRALASTSVRYSLVDQEHLRAATGAEDGVPLPGPYVTERGGHPLALFPVSRLLAAQLQALEPARAAQHLLELGMRAAPARVTLALTGEQLGLWPALEDRVRPGGWLEGFLAALEEEPRFRPRTPGDVLDEDGVVESVYVPAAVPVDMEAALWPPAARLAVETIVHEPVLRGARPFLRAGAMEAFLTRFPEANRLHKRMLQVSAKLDEVVRASQAGALERSGADQQDRVATAQRHLYAGQCNTAYWPAARGGLTVNALRHSLYESLLRAEVILDDILEGPQPPPVVMEAVDVDADLTAELVLRNRLVQAVVAPRRGGALWTFDHRPSAFALLDLLSRPGEGERLAFTDRFYPRDVAPADVAEGRARDVGSLARAHYRVVERQLNGEMGGTPSVEVTLGATGTLALGGDPHEVVVEKSYLLAADAAAVQVVYAFSVRGERSLRCTFAPEVNVTLLAGDAPDRFYEGPGLPGRLRLDSRGSLRGGEINLVDGFYRLRVVLSGENAVHTVFSPVQTQDVETGALHYQGSCLQPLFPLVLVPGKTAVVSVMLGVEQL